MDRDHDSSAAITAASRGDEAAIAELLRRHLPGLRAYVALRMGRAVEARGAPSDIVQSTCLELLRGLERFEYRGEAAFRSWLYRAAVRKILQRNREARAGRRDVVREDPSPDPDLVRAYSAVCTPSRVAMAREDLEAVDAAFDRLPDEYREVILMSRLVGLSHAEIAVELGKSEGAVRVLLHRALARLSVLMT